jgi:hypothetical protein
MPSSDDSGAVAVAVIRVSFDPMHPATFVARITECDDISDPDWTRRVHGSADAAGQEVARWLHQLGRSGRRT